MAKILLVDNDENILAAMKTYLTWCGIDVNVFNSSREVIPALSYGGYDLLICDAFIAPVDCYTLCNKIRGSGDRELSKQQIMIVAPEPLNKDDYLFIERNDIYFMNKYEHTGLWGEKIGIILKK